MTLAAKAALCVCPTVIMGTAAVTLPKARQAVHKATAKAPRSAAAKSRNNKHRPVQSASLSMPCPPAFAGLAPPIAGVGPINWDVGGGSGTSGQFGSGLPGGGGIGGGIIYSGGGAPGGTGGGGGGGDGSVTPPVDGPIAVVPSPGASAVPEPATWLLLVGGFGVAGGALRLRRRRTLATASGRVGILPWRVRAGAVLTMSAPDAVGMAAVTGKTATLAKLALCVCPPALLVGTVATVPAARQAVHAATAPAYKAVMPAVAFRPMALELCVPVVESAQSSGSGAGTVLSVRSVEASALSI